MAADGDEPITDHERIRISSDFLVHSPPGEFNEVLHDVRMLLGNDTLLKDCGITAFSRYNKEQLMPVRIEGAKLPVLITDYNDLGNGTFYDPRTQQSFKYDHLQKEAFDFAACKPDKKVESWRQALENTITPYTHDHYKNGISSIFGKTEDGILTLTVCIEDHQFQPKNFWNGRWRSVWSVSFIPGATVAEISGVLKVQVHYYEDGNVQLVTSKEITDSIRVNSERQMATEFVQLVEDAESEYQLALAENYQSMSDTTFKALRRLLPVTRMKIDWNKILTYKIGTELKHQM